MHQLFEVPITNTNKCGKCQYIEKHECNSKFFFYCGITKSNRTSNGQLKVKCKTIACKYFKPILNKQL